MLHKMELYPDYIFYGGSIHTVDRRNTVAEAIAVSGNRILAVGSSEDVLTLRKSNTRVANLHGASLIPGIIDSHNHAWEAGRFLDGVVTFGLRSIDDLKQAVRLKAEGLSGDDWLQGGGWIESQFREKRMPTRHDLDVAAPDVPVVLERIFSACVANSRALQLAGINRDTPDPQDGEIERDPETGEPNGILHRGAKMLVRRAMPGPFGASSFGDSGAEVSITRALSEYVSCGITGIVEPGVSPALCRTYQKLRDNRKLALRVNLMPNWHGFALAQEMEHMERLIEEMGFYTGFGDEWLSLGALKMAIDGGLTSRTAYKSFSYVDEVAPRSVSSLPIRLDLSRLEGWVKKAHDSGWSVGIHVVGDVAQDLAVDAIFKAYMDNPVRRRHQIIHGYYATPATLRKMNDAAIIAALQPAFIYGEADGYNDLLHREDQEKFMPLRSYMNAGVRVAMSTDMPSAHHNPFWGMYSAVTRKGMLGHQLGSREAVTIPEALRMMTINSAYVSGEEKFKGSLEPGKLADLAVVNVDLGEIEPEALRDISVELTMIDGEIVYERPR